MSEASSATMRILHLVSYPIYSGPLPPTRGLALAQRRAGHRVFLAHGRGGEVTAADGTRYEEAAAPRLAADGLAPPVALELSTKSSPLRLWRDRAALTELVRDGIDVVHTHMSHDHVLAVLAGARRWAAVVRTIHAPRSLGRRPGQRWLHRRADALIVRCAQHRALAVDLLGDALTPVHLIRGGVDVEDFVPAAPLSRRAARVRFGLPADADVILHAALLDHRGQEELVEALVRLHSSSTHILFAGGGRLRSALERVTAEIGLGGKVHYVGPLGTEDLRHAYHAADAAFVARGGNDASMRSALEAMACALPVIGLAHGAVAEMVTDSVGYPFAHLAPGPVAAVLRRWRDDEPANRRARGLAARRYVIEERTFAREAEATVDLYRQLTKGVLPRSVRSES